MRFLIRFLSLLSLVAAVMAGVLDAIQSVAANQVLLTPATITLEGLMPGSVAAFETTVRTHLPGWAWDGVMAPILAQPAFVVLLALSFLLWIIGYRRQPAAGRFAA